MTKSVWPDWKQCCQRGPVNPRHRVSDSLAIDMSAPVLPAETAAPARPCFTRSMAMPIDVVFGLADGLRSLVIPRNDFGRMNDLRVCLEIGMISSAAEIAVSSPTKSKVRPGHRRRARATPRSMTASPSSPPIASMASRGASATWSISRLAGWI